MHNVIPLYRDEFGTLGVKRARWEFETEEGRYGFFCYLIQKLGPLAPTVKVGVYAFHGGHVICEKKVLRVEYRKGS